jgi:hypothetical protein
MTGDGEREPRKVEISGMVYDIGVYLIISFYRNQTIPFLCTRAEFIPKRRCDSDWEWVWFWTKEKVHLPFGH